MKRMFWPVYLALSLAAYAQQPPTLSTSDRVAIAALEKAKADARKQYDDAMQSEQAVLNEWLAAHPGYHLNPQTFAVEADPKPKETPKP